MALQSWLIEKNRRDNALRPLYLYRFTFSDGFVWRCSSHEITWNGQTYAAFVLGESFPVLAQRSQNGIAGVANVSVTLNNADRFVQNLDATRSFVNADLQIDRILVDLKATVPADRATPDSKVVFRGICGMPQVEPKRIELQARSRLDLSRGNWPSIPIQRTCPWQFPSKNSERQAAASDHSSWFWDCGYSPDISHPEARGNNAPGGQPFTSCARTKAACVERGMYGPFDSSNRETGSFGGAQWAPPATSRVRPFGDKWQVLKNSEQVAKFGKVHPGVLGDGYLDPIVMNTLASGNETKGEARLFYGEAVDVIRVLVNDIDLPAAQLITGQAVRVESLSACYRIPNIGTRRGKATRDTLFTDAAGNPVGDPNGSFATVEFVVPSQVTDASSTPSVRVLARGPKLIKFESPSFAPEQTTGNEKLQAAWQILHLLSWNGIDYDLLDRASFTAIATLGSFVMNYPIPGGGTGQHPRFESSAIVQDPTSIGETAASLLRTFGGVLLETGGLIKLAAKGTLAEQHNAPVSGSNTSTPVPSKRRDGTNANGYPAFRFDMSTVRRRDGSLAIRRLARPLSDLPNGIQASYQDKHNDFALDSVKFLWADAVARTGDQERFGETLRYVLSFDQARRCSFRELAEGLLGNAQNQPSGTTWIELEAWFDADHLKLFDLVLVHLPEEGYTNQLFRVQSIKPNGPFVTLELSWHDDAWYLDSYGQGDGPIVANRGRDQLRRPAYPLLGQTATPDVKNALFENERSFGIRTAEIAGTPSAELTFRPACNTLEADLRPPLHAYEAGIQTGGTLTGGRVWHFAFAAIDESGKISGLSQVGRAVIANPLGTNWKIVVGEFDWHPRTKRFALFLGLDPNHLYHQATSSVLSSLPTSVEITSFDRQVAKFPAPDQEYDHAVVVVQAGRNHGYFANLATGVDPATNRIQLESGRLAVNQFQGKILSVLGETVDGWDTGPIASWRIVSNGTDFFEIDPATGPVLPANLDDRQWLITVRMQANELADITSDQVTLPQLDNAQAVEDALLIADASNSNPIVITTQAPHGFASGDRVRHDAVTGNTFANGIFDITVIDETTYSIPVAGNGAYEGGGAVRRLTRGLTPEEARGKILRIIAGTGRGQKYRIRSNTPTSVRIEGSWVEKPDLTSVFITHEPDELIRTGTQAVTVAEFENTQPTALPLNLSGYSKRQLVFSLISVDGGDNECFQPIVRDTFFFRELGAVAQIASSVGTVKAE
jgi:hypothetical protein